MSWLAAALYCRPSSDESCSGLSYCRPLVERADAYQSETRDQTWNIRFELTSKSTKQHDLPSGQCWVGLFRSPIVVEGYPTLSRPQEADGAGLEIPLDIAAQLLQARRVTAFDGRLFVKGFCAMLTLSKAVEDSQTFVWHLMTNSNGGYISYHEHKREKLPPCEIGSDTAFLTRLFQYGRHFVGWCNEADSFAGEYDMRLIYCGAAFADAARYRCD